MATVPSERVEGMSKDNRVDTTPAPPQRQGCNSVAELLDYYPEQHLEKLARTPRVANPRVRIAR